MAECAEGECKKVENKQERSLSNLMQGELNKMSNKPTISNPRNGKTPTNLTYIYSVKKIPNIIFFESFPLCGHHLPIRQK